jgi:hypothetical protein
MNDKNETSTGFVFVDPKNDVAFRKIFGDENKKEIETVFIIDIIVSFHYSQEERFPEAPGANEK